MIARMNAHEVAPEAIKPYLAVERYLAACRLPAALIPILKIRASQMNGCAYCIEMHTREAKKHGQAPERLLLLSAWRESSAFTAQERAALAWTEALTAISPVPDTIYEALQEHFSPAEIVDLTVLITMINAWNRIAVGFRYAHPPI